jgi:hypothetical protein
MLSSANGFQRELVWPSTRAQHIALQQTSGKATHPFPETREFLDTFRTNEHLMLTDLGSSRNPEKFAPERWLGDPDYKDDRRDAHQPFSVGTRNCLGMNMAWHEMRLLLGKLLYNFDIESDVGPDWLEQKVFVIWDRKPLPCRLKEATPRI